MEKDLIQILDNIILDKALLRVNYKEITSETGLSSKTISDILNPHKRCNAKIDTVLKMIKYFDKLKLEREGK